MALETLNFLLAQEELIKASKLMDEAKPTSATSSLSSILEALDQSEVALTWANASRDKARLIATETSQFLSGLIQSGARDISLESFTQTLTIQAQSDPEILDQGVRQTILNKIADQILEDAIAKEEEAVQLLRERRVDDYRKAKSQAEQLVQKASDMKQRVAEFGSFFVEHGIDDVPVSDFLSRVTSGSQPLSAPSEAITELVEEVSIEVPQPPLETVEPEEPTQIVIRTILPKIEKEMSVPQVVLDEKNRVLKIDDQELRFRSGVVWELARFFVSHPNEVITPAMIDEVARNVGSQSTFYVNISNLRQRLGNIANPRLLLTTEGPGGIAYRLNAEVSLVGTDTVEAAPVVPAVETVENSLVEPETMAPLTEVEVTEETREGKRNQIFENPVPEVKLLALLEIFDGPQVNTQDIIDILGSTKAGRPFTSGQASYSLAKACDFLYVRIRENVATDQERSIWEQIRSVSVSDHDLEGKAVLHSVKEKVREWFHQRQGGSNAAILEEPQQIVQQVTRPTLTEIHEPSQPSIEEEDPHVRETVSNYIREMVSVMGPDAVWTGAMIQNAFPGFTGSWNIDFYRKAESRGIIKIEAGSGRNYHPRYSLEDIAMLRYYSDTGTVLDRRDRRQLRRIFRDELARIEEEKRKASERAAFEPADVKKKNSFRKNH